jgi:hypothetical protein
MRSADTVPLLNSPELETRTAFNVVILYEEFETGKRAKLTYDFLVETMGADCQFRSQIWKFEALSDPALLDLALRDAAEADIVVISSQGGDVPSEVRTWLEAWLVLAANPLALVALFDPAREIPRTQSARAFLSGVAERGRMEFFAPLVDESVRRPADREFSFPGRAELRENSWATYAAVEEEDYRGVSHWGINE